MENLSARRTGTSSLSNKSSCLILQRVVGKPRRVIPPIPLEIYLEVVDHLGPPPDTFEYIHAARNLELDMKSLRNRTIHSMALVCRDFYHHIFPLLFENVVICRDPHSGKRPLHSSHFLQSIVDGDERARLLATRIKIYAIVDFAPDMMWANDYANLSVYSKALKYMSNLKGLYLYKTLITNDFLRSTLSLPPLKVLRIDGWCPVQAHLDETLAREFANVEINQVIIHDMDKIWTPTTQPEGYFSTTSAWPERKSYRVL